MSAQFISTGLEPEFLTTRIEKIESAGPGLARLYWIAEREGAAVCAYTQLVLLAHLPAIREAMLFAPPSETSSAPARAAMN